MQFLKNIFVATMLVSVLIQTFATVAIIMQFESNRSYYAEVLCINKNRPEMACQGKCILMQRLNNQYEQEQQTTNHKLKNLIDRELTLFCQNTNLIDINSFLKIVSDKAIFNSYSKNFFPQSTSNDIFHPPAQRV